MARFILWSDLHLEFQGFKIPSLDEFDGPLDGVLLAGDIDTGLNHQNLKFAQKINEYYDLPVVIIAGNHEYYGSEMKQMLRDQVKECARINHAGGDVRLLAGTSTVIAGARIIGATLWTDFELDPATGLQSRRTAAALMNDYRTIRFHDGKEARKLLPSDIEKAHYREKAEIFDILAKPFEGPTIVVTHHMPIAQAIHSMYLHDALNASFASNLLDEILPLNFDAWIYGHSHQNNEFQLEVGGKIRQFASNPRGYPNETTHFNPLRVLEV